MANTEETVEEGSTVGARSSLVIHQGQVDWLESEHGLDMSSLSPAEVIAAAYATRVAWRKTEAYQAAKLAQAEVNEEGKAELAAAKEAAKAERQAERDRKAEEREAAKAAKAAEKEAQKGEAPATTATKPAAKKATAKKATAKKASAGTADPFGS